MPGPHDVRRHLAATPTQRTGQRTVSQVVALEMAANEAWPAPEQDRLGGWLLRAAGGWTGRANTALPLGDPGRPLAEAVEAVRAWYGVRGLPARINLPMPLAEQVHAVLDAQGWHTNPVTLVQTAPMTTLLATTAVPTAGLPPVRLSEAPSRALLDVVVGRKGAFPDTALRLLTAVPEACFAEVYADSGDLVAIARGTVTGAGRYFGIFLLEVVPAARRQGLARHVIGRLADWASQLGATAAFLQVEQHNSAAVALYERLGFSTHHHYLTRTAV